MKSIILIFIVLFVSSCSVENSSEKYETADCFTAQNFSKLKEYIQATILTSGMGKYYVEYPPDKTQVNDGNKHLSKHPENVYDIFYNDSLNQIIFKSKNAEFGFMQNGALMGNKQKTETEQDLAENLFCYILVILNKK